MPQKGGKSGPPIVPGEPDDSLLIQAIRQTHPRLKMPAANSKDEEIAAIAEWIKAGGGRRGRPLSTRQPRPTT
jgi:mono/diheme cytochrome c family protein